MEREKRRQELLISIPSFFRYPISMDVMKSPVSLCTGVTYDRSSIERLMCPRNLFWIARENVVGERLNELISKSDSGTDCLSSFSFVLQKGSSESKVKCAKFIELIALNPKYQCTIAGNPELLRQLCNLLTVETDTSAAEASFSALSAMSNSRQVKKELIRLGLVARVGEILSSSSNAARAANEKALGMLAMIATCTEGRAVIAADEECVVGIVKKLMKFSGEATENGIRVLWSVCCLGREVKGLTKVLLVMQSDFSESTSQMCRELVKVLRGKNVKSNLGPYRTRTTHIIPC